ncbi:MAG: gamma-glutamylcyclotransferase family protein [Pseudomonadota bacterium]
MSDPFFFGYGSLVNRATHVYPMAERARVSGWRRLWKRTRLRRLAFLTVTPAPGHAIDGLVAAVPGGDWAALDQREAAYLRVPVAAELHGAIAARDAHIYRTRPEHDTDATEAHPILQSYLDTVLQGFLREFGEAGIAHFVATTDGWDAPILDDREAPIYTRAQVLTPGQRALVDDQLKTVAPHRIPLRDYQP